MRKPFRIRDNSDKYDAKLDYQVNSQMNAFLRFSQRKDIPYFGPADPGPAGGDGNGFIHAIQQQAAIGYTWTVSPSQLFEARFGFDHVLGGKAPPYLGGPDIAAQFGIQGLPPSLAGGFPTQVISGFSNPTIGRQATNPQFQNPTSFNPKLNYSLIKGRHSIKAGYEFLAIRTEVLDINPLYGSDTYAGGFSKPTAARMRLHAAERRHQLRSRRLLFRPSQHHRAGQQPHHQSAAACPLSLCAGRLARHAEADPEPRPALGICHADLGSR